MNKKGLIVLIILCIIIVAVVVGTKMLNKEENKENKNSNVETNIDGNNTSSQAGQPAGDYATMGESGNKINTSGKLQDTKNLNGLEINNVNLETLSNKTVMLADVKNTTKNKINEKKIKIDLLSEDGKVVKTLEGTIDAVEAEQITQLSLETEGDFVNVYDYRIYE